MHEPVDRGERHCRIGEDPVPFAEELVGGADQFEEDGGFRLVARDVGQVVENVQMVLVELIAPCATTPS